jgi:O-antigen/teichoic acid export membrane protein
MPASAVVGTINAFHQQGTTRIQVRGSSLFLLGRFLSLGISFAAQLLIVRYLSTTEYGALAFALSVVAMLQLLGTLGLQEAISRFVPIYRETREYDKLLGTILLAAALVVLTGMLIIVGVQGVLSHITISGTLKLRLLTVLIFLVPIEAADMLLDAFFASFASTRDIFVRKYALGPALKLGAVCLIISMNGTITFLTYGYLTASALGVLIYCSMLLRLLSRHQIFTATRHKRIKIPAREVLAFIIPGLSGILATAAISPINVFLIGQMRPLSEAAYYRAAIPLAELNGVVLASFTLLYTPNAARLFLQQDYAGINNLYWETAAWMSMLSFPIFAVTFSLARPLTVFLYGPRYTYSGPVLALLSMGSYFNVALGFNLQTLKVFGRLRYVIVASAGATLANLGLNLFLVPRFGAIGAAAGAVTALISYNLVLQAGLRPIAHFKAFDRRYLPVYVTIASGALGLLLLQLLVTMSFYVALPLAGCVSLLVAAVTKKRLRIAQIFPELLRLPFMRLILT